MRKDVSNTGRGKAILVKGKDSQYHVVRYYENSYGQCFISVYEADKHGVAKSSTPLKSDKYAGSQEDKFEETIAELEYVPKKKKVTKTKKKTKKSTKSKKKKSNVKTKKQTKRTSTKKTKTSTSKKKEEKEEVNNVKK